MVVTENPLILQCLEEAEKHATMLMFLNDNVVLQHEEEKKKNVKLAQAVAQKDQELK